MTPRSYRGRRRARALPTLLITVLLIAVSAILIHRGNTTLTVEHFAFTSERLPGEFDGCTIVHLSDLHGAVFGENNAELISAVAGAQPDFIVITGDLLDMHRETPIDYAVSLCTALEAIAPTYFVTGNHEWALGTVPELKTALAAAGVTVLSNNFVALERGSDRIILAGIDDPNGYADQKTPEELAEEIHAAYEDPFWLLLAHRNSRFVKSYAALGADLTLSGHAHGGLIRLPGTDGLISAERTLFPEYTAGFYEKDGATLFVSRGLGNSGYTFRLFNRPQVAVLTLKRG